MLKMPIKNKLYREFLDRNNLEIINIRQIQKVLNLINEGLKTEAARALVILMYYSGARPTEALNCIAEDIKKDGRTIVLFIRTLKKGKDRYIEIQFNKPLINELYNFAIKHPPKFELFNQFKGNYKDIRHTKKGPKEVIKHHQKVYYYIKKWFKAADIDITPYYLRHNRFTSMMENGATIEDVMLYKGARSQDSVIPYMHSTKERRIKTARYVN